MRRSAIRRHGGLLLLAPVLALMLTLAPSAAPRAADYDGEPPPDYIPECGPPQEGCGSRKSTWEINTSLTFYRYLEPFPRVDSAHACRDRCANNRRCTGWTYYDANFNEAGRYSYRLQRLCVLGAGVKDKQSGTRPGRTSGVMRSSRYDAVGGGG